MKIIFVRAEFTTDQINHGTLYTVKYRVLPEPTQPFLLSTFSYLCETSLIPATFLMTGYTKSKLHLIYKLNKLLR